MLTKLLLFFIGVLALIQLLLYNQILQKNDRQWSVALKEVDAAITAHQNDIIKAQQAVTVMEKNMSNVPATILEGVKDPEKKFLDFMDYLENSDIEKLHGSYKIANKPTIKYKPVPLQKTDFVIEFQFSTPEKLESVLGYLLNQQQEYPLHVNKLEIKRIPKKKPEVFLDVSLLLPAKLQRLQKNNVTGSKAIGG